MFDPKLNLYKIHSRTSITYSQREMVHKLGWVIYMDGYNQLHAMIDAPEEAYDKLSSIFTTPDKSDDDDDDELYMCWGCGEKMSDYESKNHRC